MKFLFVASGIFFAFCKAEVRIAGGNDTSIAEYPFAVALLSNADGRPTFEQVCGGTILTPNAILSASSCFYTGETPHQAASWRARVGSSHSNTGGLTYLIRAITVHPEFVPGNASGQVDINVAVLRTTFNIAMGPGVAAARIAGAGYTFEDGAVVTAIGWGDGSDQDESSTQLKRVDMWLVGQDTCAGRYNMLGVQVTQRQLCAGWIDVGVRGQCNGDVGSPLLDANGIVVGVFSFAEGCADLRYPGVNTRLSSFTNWIISAAVA